LLVELGTGRGRWNPGEVRQAAWPQIDRETAYSAPGELESGELEYRPGKERSMSLGTILLIILILALIGAFPSWPYSSGWGYYPAGGIGTILVIVLILVLLGRV
jgi:hypothetical protein